MIWLILVFVLGFLLGLWVAWIFWRQRAAESQSEVRRLQVSLNEKEQRVQALQARVDAQKGREEEMAAPAIKATPTRAPEASPPVLEPKPDNLQRIEGIGPKIAQLLQDNGINTFAQLAATDPSRLEQILRAANLRLADPKTWPEQARLAAAGDWKTLEVLQEDLKGGRRVS